MLSASSNNIFDLSYVVLTTDNPVQKCKITFDSFQNKENISFSLHDSLKSPPLHPSRPEKPNICEPSKVKQRKINKNREGRFALLHALAHIELNAVDLAWDIILRFSNQKLPSQFYLDWLSVAYDEAKHFTLLQKRLNDLNGTYGDLNAHGGLWEAAIDTKNNLLARLAIVPMVLEARGLDVTPAMIKRLKACEDEQSANILQIIHDEEINHVKIGQYWFEYLCHQHGYNSKTKWQDLVKEFFKGTLKPPFNVESRNLANFPEDWYNNISL